MSKSARSWISINMITTHDVTKEKMFRMFLETSPAKEEDFASWFPSLKPAHSIPINRTMSSRSAAAPPKPWERNGVAPAAASSALPSTQATTVNNSTVTNLNTTPSTTTAAPALPARPSTLTTGENLVRHVMRR